MYTCPMHPEVKKHNPGRCPKCGMKLIREADVSTKMVSGHADQSSSWKDYISLIVIVGLILITSGVVSLRDFSVVKFLAHFMTGFFLVFAGFKLIDPKGFAQGYSTYDLLAKKFFTYGYIYPYIELLFGLIMIYGYNSKGLFLAEFFVMIFSGIGVAQKLLKKETFQCVCLGTFLKVPLTKVTLIEDFGMAILALLMFFLT